MSNTSSSDSCSFCEKRGLPIVPGYALLLPQKSPRRLKLTAACCRKDAGQRHRISVRTPTTRRAYSGTVISMCLMKETEVVRLRGYRMRLFFPFQVGEPVSPALQKRP